MPNIPDDGKAQSFARTPLFAMVNAGVWVIAAIAAGTCWICWAVTFTPWAQHLPSTLFVPFFVLMFPLFGWAVWLLAVVRRPPGTRRGAADWTTAISPAGRVLVGLAVAAAVAGGATAASALGGQPEYDPTTHTYDLDNHGSLIVVSRAAYLHAVAAQNRLFLGVTLVFLTIACCVAYGDWSRHRPAISPFRGLPQPTRPRPRIGVPAAALVLAAALALAGTAVGGLQIIDSVSAWGSHAIYLKVGRPVAANLAPGQYTVFAGCTQDMTCGYLDPGSVTIGRAGHAVHVVPDPSSDHDSEDGQSFVGELSFSIAQVSAVQIELTDSPGQPVFVVPSEGQEARSLIGWIALTGAALLILIASLVGLGRLAWWRLSFTLADAPPA
jgi:hypothetical protein